VGLPWERNFGVQYKPSKLNSGHLQIKLGNAQVIECLRTVRNPMLTRIVVSRGLFSVVISAVGLLVGANLSAQAKNSSDVESGTLVMIARTKSAVIVSVDSRIDTDAGFLRPPSLWTDGTRKLVDVGERGACGLDGWIGDEKLDLAPAVSLRTWAKNHPNEGPAVGIDNLLKVSAATWNQLGAKPGEPLPKNRQVNSVITTLLCGDFVNGHPVIVRGETFVNPDFTAGFRILPPGMGDVLYVDGTVGNRMFRVLLTNPPKLELVLDRRPDLPKDKYRKVRNDMLLNLPAMASFIATESGGDHGQIDSPNEDGSNAYIESTWTQSSAQDLFRAFYKSVEQNFAEVGPPNNVRIITSCCRLSTTVEANPWPTCPVKKATTRQRFPIAAPRASAR
jgi:hypothetical protein